MCADRVERIAVANQDRVLTRDLSCHYRAIGKLAQRNAGRQVGQGLGRFVGHRRHPK